jgi:uncharacterized protein
MTITVSHIGTIDWVDLSAPDPAAAQTFYAKILQWTYEASESAMGTYHFAMTDGHLAAGLMATAPGGASGWTIYVKVSSLEETLAAIVDASGSVITPPFEIPGGARIAVAADPAGGVFAIIAGGPEPDITEPPLRRAQHGAVAWGELLSRDPHAAISFYDAVFGWQATLDPASGYTTLRLDEIDIGGLLPMPPQVPTETPSHWTVYFHVSDIASAVHTALTAGGTQLVEPTKVGAMTFAVLADPAGATFGVLTGE